jgi:hypothetical protein
MSTGMMQRPEHSLSKDGHMYLLKQVWPAAPDSAVVFAAVLCHDYGLHPMMRQVFLVPFKNNDKTEWNVILGIRATRTIAQNAGYRWTYRDGPRVMSEDEQKRIFGEADINKIKAITIIRDQAGNEFPGYGTWDKSRTAYGTDKGNSAVNMAFIRSERNAIDRMAPGVLPPDVDVIEDNYAPVNMKQSLKQGQQDIIIEGEKAVNDLWEKDDVPVALISENKAADLKALCQERKCDKQVGTYILTNFPGVKKLRDLTNEQYDELFKNVTELK